jgi:hypothetical protein
LNRQLRGDAKLTPYNENLKILISQALDNSKDKHVGWVFRGTDLNNKLLKFYQEAFDKGSTIKHNFFTSTSNEISASFSGNVKFSIYSKRGVHIEGLSIHGAAEKEVLLNFGSEFKIISMREADGTTYIKMEEI